MPWVVIVLCSCCGQFVFDLCSLWFLLVRLSPQGGIISGMRGNCDVVIHIDVKRAIEAGLPLYRSANEVILSPGFDGAVPVELFARAVRIKDGSLLWPPPPGPSE